MCVSGAATTAAESQCNLLPMQPSVAAIMDGHTDLPLVFIVWLREGHRCSLVSVARF